MPRTRLTDGLAREKTPSKQVSTSTEVAEIVIQRTSPEGRPAHPQLGATDLGALVVGTVGIAAVAAVGAALLGATAIAGAIVVITLLFLALNPEVWATIFRARERARVFSNDPGRSG